jgi:hypothetical protein
MDYPAGRAGDALKAEFTVFGLKFVWLIVGLLGRG